MRQSNQLDKSLDLDSGSVRESVRARLGRNRSLPTRALRGHSFGHQRSTVRHFYLAFWFKAKLPETLTVCKMNMIPNQSSLFGMSAGRGDLPGISAMHRQCSYEVRASRWHS